MHVVHTVAAVSNESSGVTAVVLPLCKVLLGLGVTVDLLSLDWAPMEAPPFFLRRFPLGHGPRKLGNSPKMQQWLYENARTRSFNLIHSHGLWMLPNIYPGRTAHKFDLPLITTPHGTLSEWAMDSGSIMKKIFWLSVQRRALDRSACFHATAESEYEDIRRLGFRQPVAIIPNGIDIPDLPPKKQGDSRTLLFLGRIHPKKGLDMLLPAWQVVQDRFPEWRLRIVGPDDGGYLAQMQLLAGELGLERIEFSGVLYGSEKSLAYGQADLFVLPTYSENFGIAVAEALVAGIPAIVTKGAPWVGLENHRAGWWIDIGPNPLIDCLKDALSRSPDELANMGDRGRSWMQEELNWKGVAAKMSDTYDWLCDKSKQAPSWVHLD